MQEIPTFIPVVAAALIRADGQVLMQQRRKTGQHGGLWEFPGGKLEQGEAPETALCRELHEELGIAVAPGTLVPLSFASDPRTDPRNREPYVILLYICREWAGDPRCLDGEAIGWFAPAAIGGLAMPPLDVPLAAALLADAKRVI